MDAEIVVLRQGDERAPTIYQLKKLIAGLPHSDSSGAHTSTDRQKLVDVAAREGLKLIE